MSVLVSPGRLKYIETFLSVLSVSLQYIMQEHEQVKVWVVLNLERFIPMGYDGVRMRGQVWQFKRPQAEDTHNCEDNQHLGSQYTQTSHT